MHSVQSLKGRMQAHLVLRSTRTKRLIFFLCLVNSFVAQCHSCIHATGPCLCRAGNYSSCSAVQSKTFRFTVRQTRDDWELYIHLAEMRFFQASGEGRTLLNVCSCRDHESFSCATLTDDDITTSHAMWNGIRDYGPRAIVLELCTVAVVSEYEWVTSDENNYGDPISWTLETQTLDTNAWVLLHDFNSDFTGGLVTEDRRSVIGPFDITPTASACTVPNTCSVCPHRSDSWAGSTGITQCVCGAGFILDAATGICTPCTSTASACMCSLFSESHDSTSCRCVSGAYGGCGSGSLAVSGACPSCVRCPDNSNSPYDSTAIAACVCNAGYTGSSGACSACPAATHKASPGPGNCTSCPPNYNAASLGMTECLCKDWAFDQAGVCKGCVAGKYLLSYIPICRMWQSCYSDPDWDHNKLHYFCEECARGKTSLANSVSAGSCICAVGYGDSGGGCTQCAKGTYSTPAQLPCKACPVRSTTEGLGRTSVLGCWCVPGAGGPDGGPCEICLPGTYHEEYQRTVDCWSCPPHSSSTVTGSVSRYDCKCNAGYVASTLLEYVDCHPCPYGTYARDSMDANDANGTQLCVSCPSGKYNPFAAKTACSDCIAHSHTAVDTYSAWDCVCNAGYTRSADASVCGRCNASQFFDIASSECQPCRDNYVSLAGSVSHGDCQCRAGYTEDTGGIVCERCPAYQFFDRHAARCRQCASNSVSLQGAISYRDCLCEPGHSPLNFDNQGNFRCVPCLRDTHKNSTAQEPCSPCPPYSHTTSEGSVSVAQCLCNFGILTTPTGECGGDCMAGTYKENAICAVCPTNSRSPPGSTSRNDCLCQPGYVSGVVNGDFCAICPPDTYHSAGTNLCVSCPHGTHTHYELLFQGGVLVRLLRDVSLTAHDCFCNAGMAGPPGGPCIRCEGGTYKNQSTLQSPNAACTACPANTNSPSGSYTIADCRCKPGWIGSGGSSECVSCGPDEISTPPDYNLCKCKHALARSSTSTSCEACETGKYWYDGGMHENSCLFCGMYQTAPSNGESIASCMCDFGSTQTQSADWTGRITCEKCLLGTYKDTQGPATCNVCPTNTVSSTSRKTCICLAGSSRQLDGQCVPCAENSDAPRESTGACACNAGFKGPSVSGACEACEAGSYGIGGASGAPAVCTDCVAGKYQYYAGMAVCRQCHANTQSTAARTGCTCNAGYFEAFTFDDFNVLCETCSAGEYHLPAHRVAGGLTECLPCELGTFKNFSGLALCGVCPPHSTTYGLGATEQAECLCGPGRFHGGGLEMCTRCAAGKFSNVVGATGCTECPGNTESLQGALQVGDCFCSSGMFLFNTAEMQTGNNASMPICEQCPAGKYKFVKGDSPCTPCAVRTSSQMGSAVCDCAPGFFQSSWYQEKPITPACEPCAPHTYKASVGTSICLACPENTLAIDAGASSCQPCPVGEHLWYSPEGRVCVCKYGDVRSVVPAGGEAVCVPCAAGKYYSALFEACTLCRLNTYKNDTGKAACLPCPQWSSLNATGSTQRSDCICIPETSGADGGPCTECVAGKYKRAAGSASCEACPVGEYSYESPDYSGCLACPLATYWVRDNFCAACPQWSTSGMGSVSLHDCECWPGYEPVTNASCAPCRRDSYKGSVAWAACTACPTNSVSVVGSTVKTDCICSHMTTGPAGGPCASCQPDTYKNGGINSACVDCPANSYAFGINPFCYCNIGFYATGTWENTSAACVFCGPGKYADVGGATVCKDCAAAVPPHLSAYERVCDCRPRVGSVCWCNAGFFDDIVDAYAPVHTFVCRACAPNSYRRAGELNGTITNTQDDCTACPPHSYSYSRSTARDNCTCAAGYFRSDAAEWVCLSCGLDTYKDMNSSECLACPVNTTTKDPEPLYISPIVPIPKPAALSRQECLCKPGYVGAGGGPCSPCPPATYKTEIASLLCKACPPNSDSLLTAATSIKDCKCNTGYFDDSDRYDERRIYRECVGCAANQYRCTDCDTAGAKYCLDCVNSVSPVASLTIEACRCNAGWTLAAGHACVGCGIGKYKDTIGSASCTNCPSNTNSSQLSVSVQDCKCIAGWTWAGRDTGPCTACALGLFKRIPGNMPCTLCPAGKTTTTPNGPCVCREGFTAISSGMGHAEGAACEPCALGTYKNTTGPQLCDACPSWSATTTLQNSQRVACQCDPGATGPHGGPCTRCEPGKHKVSRGNSVCDTCPVAQYSAPAGRVDCDHCPLRSSAPEASTSRDNCTCLPGGYDSGDAASCTCSPGFAPTSATLTCYGGCACTPLSGAVRGDISDGGLRPDKFGDTSEDVGICVWVITTNDPTSDISLSFSALNVGPNYMADEVQLGNCVPPCMETTQIALLYGTLTSVQLDYNGGPDFMVQDTNFTSSTGILQVTFWMPTKRLVPSGFTAHWRMVSSNCLACPLGQHKYAGGDGVCVHCLHDQYSSSAGAGSCQDCPENSNSPPASTRQTDCTCNAGYTGLDGGACAQCASGKYKFASTTDYCERCPANAESPAGSNSIAACRCALGSTGPDGGICNLCRVGTYKSQLGSQACTNCSSGTYTTVQGAISAVSCLACPPGSDSVPGSASVVHCACNAGYLGLNGGVCLQCEPGKYKQDPGEAACLLCPLDVQGRVQSSLSGSTSPSACFFSCPAGSFGPDGGPCVLCLSGKYKAEPGTLPCVHSCPLYTESLQGSTSVSDCVCVAGRSKAVNGSCTLCIAGKYKIAPGDALCTHCLADQYSGAVGATSGVCRSCPANSNAPEASGGEVECKCKVGWAHRVPLSEGHSGESDTYCTACERGTYTSSPGSLECSECTATQYSDPLYFGEMRGANSTTRRMCTVQTIALSKGVNTNVRFHLQRPSPCSVRSILRSAVNWTTGDQVRIYHPSSGHGTLNPFTLRYVGAKMQQLQSLLQWSPVNIEPTHQIDTTYTITVQRIPLLLTLDTYDAG